LYGNKALFNFIIFFGIQSQNDLVYFATDVEVSKLRLLNRLLQNVLWNQFIWFTNILKGIIYC